MSASPRGGAPLPGSVRAFLLVAIPLDVRGHVIEEFEAAWERDARDARSRLAVLRLWWRALTFAAYFLVDRLREAVVRRNEARGAEFPGRLELKLASRAMVRSPLLGVTAILSIAIGITLATGAFVVVRGVMGSTLPVPDGARVVQLRDVELQHGWDELVEQSRLVERRQALRGTVDLAAFAAADMLVEVPGGSTRVVPSALLSANALDVLAVPAMSGRTFSLPDERSGQLEVVVLSASLARALLGDDRTAVGTTIRVDGVPRTVIGLMDETFRFPYQGRLWVPMPAERVIDDGGARFRLFGRLAPDVTIDAASAAFTLVGQREAAAAPPGPEKAHRVLPFTAMAGNTMVGVALWTTVGALVLLLLVTAGNVANLLLARSAARAFEFAVRASLGARRGRILGQLAMEGAMIVAVAAGAGTAGANVMLRRFGEAVPDLPYWIALDVGVTDLAFVIALAFIVTAVATLLPARQVLRFSMAGALKETGPTVRFGRLGAALLGAQLAVAIGFLGGASAVGRGLLAFGADTPMAAAEETLVAQLYFGLPPVLRGANAPADSPVRRAAWQEHEARSRVAALALAGSLGSTPGIEKAALGSAFPGNELPASVMEIDEGPGGGVHRTRFVEAGRGYFDLLAVTIAEGREVQEGAAGSTEAVVNASFVARYGAGIGRRVRRIEAGMGGERIAGPWLQIVGIVPDLALNPGNPASGDGIYVPLPPSSVVRIAVRGRAAAASLAPLLHAEVRRLDPQPQVQWSKSLASQVREPVIGFRVAGGLLLVLGGIAFLLSAMGVYAQLSLGIAQRRREIAVRLALGAGRLEVTRAVLRRLVVPLAGGVIAGLLLAAGVGAAMSSLPYELARSMPGGFAGTGGVLLAVALGACLVPLRRAGRVPPSELMRAN